MSFAHPLALLLLLLLVPVGLLYWLRVRAPIRTVGTMHFWEKALAEEKDRRRWQRWRSPVSLAVQMIIVIIIAVAAAGPQVPAPKRMVLIIDNSATMRATDVPPTRLDAAKNTALRLIEGLRECDEMAVVALCPTPWEVQPLTSDRSLLNSAVDSVPATAEPPQVDWAVRLARQICMPDEDRLKPELRAANPPRIVLITDASAREATRRAQAGGVEVLRVGTAAGNLAITRFAARRSKADPKQCEFLVEVQNQGNQTAQGSLKIAIDEKPLQLSSPDQPSVGDQTGVRDPKLHSPAARGAGGEGGLPTGRGTGDPKLPSPSGRGAGGEGSSPPVATPPFTIVNNGRWQHICTLDLPAAARIKATIEPGDAYAFDDTAVLDVPAAPVTASSALGQTGIGPMGLISPIAPSLSPGQGEPGADIRVPADIGSDASAMATEKPATPLWLVPAVVAAALVIIEWCLYQRRWTI